VFYKARQMYFEIKETRQRMLSEYIEVTNDHEVVNFMPDYKLY
jgi:predicted RNA-binding protein